MEMNNKRLLAVLCAAVMCTGVMTACTEKNEETDSSAAETTVTTVNEVEPTAEEDSEAEKEEETTPEETVDEETTGSESEMTPPMWKVSDDEGHSMIMLGSMHALQESDYPLPDSVMDVYNDAEVVAFECDTSGEDLLEAQAKMLSDMYYDDGDDISQHISEEAYKALGDFLAQSNLDIELFKSMKPWTYLSTLETLITADLPIGRENGIDYYLMAKTKEDGKELYEVETLMSQVDMQMGLSDGVYDVMFKSYGEITLEEQREAMMEMYETWKSGDADAVYLMSLGEMQEIDEEDMQYIDEYNNAMLFNRNVGMAEAAKELLASGKNVFYIVGCAHYPGEKGILALLEADGCKVEKIS